jgi:hypothetical protein
VTSLVDPSQITAADADDLAAALLVVNGEKISTRNEKRFHEAWASEQRAAIRERYKLKAEAVYKKLWSQCDASKAGHDRHNHDVGGQTVTVCKSCGHTSFRGASNSATHAERKRLAQSMNDSLIAALQKQMIELDEEAGKIVWPQADDYKTPWQRRRGFLGLNLGL